MMKKYYVKNGAEKVYGSYIEWYCVLDYHGGNFIFHFTQEHKRPLYWEALNISVTNGDYRTVKDSDCLQWTLAETTAIYIDCTTFFGRFLKCDYDNKELFEKWVDVPLNATILVPAWFEHYEKFLKRIPNITTEYEDLAYLLEYHVYEVDGEYTILNKDEWVPGSAVFIRAFSMYSDAISFVKNCKEGSNLIKFYVGSQQPITTGGFYDKWTAIKGDKYVTYDKGAMSKVWQTIDKSFVQPDTEVKSIKCIEAFKVNSVKDVEAEKPAVDLKRVAAWVLDNKEIVYRKSTGSAWLSLNFAKDGLNPNYEYELLDKVDLTYNVSFNLKSRGLNRDSIEKVIKKAVESIDLIKDVGNILVVKL